MWVGKAMPQTTPFFMVYTTQKKVIWVMVYDCFNSPQRKSSVQVQRPGGAPRVRSNLRRCNGHHDVPGERRIHQAIKHGWPGKPKNFAFDEIYIHTHIYIRYIINKSIM